MSIRSGAAPSELGLMEASAAIAAGDLSSAALAQDCLARAARVEPLVRAFAWLDPGRALRLAREADTRGAGERGPLHGIPIGVKDIIDTAGIPTECGTVLHAGRVPAEPADVVVELERAGGLVLGKTVTAELAYFSPGPTRNPWNLSRTPGGSSMGSAAAVAARMVPGAIGTQTNGSVIRPAAFCGVVGFKPTAGTLSGRGVMRFSETLDQLGAFARAVRDIGAIAAAMGLRTREQNRDRDGAPRCAIVRTSEWRHAEPAMRQRFEADVEILRRSGARLDEPPLPDGLEESVPVHRTIMAVEGARNLGPVVARDPEKVSRVLRDLLAEGTRTPDAEYRSALDQRAVLIKAFSAWASDYDAILTPPATGEAPSAETTGDPRFCTRWTLVGAPALVLPTGIGPNGLPLGLQVIAAPGADATLLEAAAWIESRIAFAESPAV